MLTAYSPDLASFPRIVPNELLVPTVAPPEIIFELNVLTPPTVWLVVKSTKFCVDAPVPPFAIATIPVTLAAVPETFPDKGPENPAAVMVPAEKFPDPSRATIAEAVFAVVAVVAELATLRAVEMVANLVSAIAAEALMSALTISPSKILTEVTALEANLLATTAASAIIPVTTLLVPIVVALPALVISPVKLAFVTTVVALPTEVTMPLRLAFVVTVPAVNPAAVPVILVPTSALGVPSAGVISVGDVLKTKLPDPVSSVTAVIKFDEFGVAKKAGIFAPKLVQVGAPVPFEVRYWPVVPAAENPVVPTAD